MTAPKAKKPAPVAKKEPPKAAREPSVSNGPAKVVRGGGGGRAAGDAARGKKGNVEAVNCEDVICGGLDIRTKFYVYDGAKMEGNVSE